MRMVKPCCCCVCMSYPCQLFNCMWLRVFEALSVGIFPYVLKLLQSSARELRPLLVFIWAKLLAVDSVRNDLTVSHRRFFPFSCSILSYNHLFSFAQFIYVCLLLAGTGLQLENLETLVSRGIRRRSEKN